MSITMYNVHPMHTIITVLSHTGLGVGEISLRVMEEQSRMFEFKGNLYIQLIILFLGEIIFPVTNFSYK